MPAGKIYLSKAKRSKRVSVKYLENPYMSLKVRRGIGSVIASNQGRKIYSFKRTWQAANINTAAGALTNSAFGFKLSDLTNSSEFTTLFDSYRIVGVKMKMVPAFNVDTARDSIAAVGNTQIPNVHTVLDYDDNTALSAVTDYMQYDTYRMTRGFKTISRFVRPKLQAAANVGGATTLALQESGKRWIDCQQNGVLYFGIKTGVESSGTAGLIYQVYFTYYLQFKSVR